LLLTITCRHLLLLELFEHAHLLKVKARQSYSLLFFQSNNVQLVAHSIFVGAHGASRSRRRYRYYRHWRSNFSGRNRAE
jgi:hypothetical protein